MAQPHKPNLKNLLLGSLTWQWHDVGGRGDTWKFTLIGYDLPPRQELLSEGHMIRYLSGFVYWFPCFSLVWVWNIIECWAFFGINFYNLLFLFFLCLYFVCVNIWIELAELSMLNYPGVPVINPTGTLCSTIYMDLAYHLLLRIFPSILSEIRELSFINIS